MVNVRKTDYSVITSHNKLKPECIIHITGTVTIKGITKRNSVSERNKAITFNIFVS